MESDKAMQLPIISCNISMESSKDSLYSREIRIAKFPGFFNLNPEHFTWISIHIHFQKN